MSRQKTEINPIRADRVKTLMKREKITQTVLAERIYQTQQNVSRIMQKRQPLTEETARLIIKAANQILHERIAAKNGMTFDEYEPFAGNYLDYRLEWLLGYDDFMTNEDYSDARQMLKDHTADGMWAIIETSLQKHGRSLRFNHRANEHLDSTQREQGDCFYTIVDSDGNELKRMTAAEMIQFENQLQEYCDFMTERHLLK